MQQSISSITSPRLYLDNAATEKLLPVVQDAMIAAMQEDLGNAAALHAEGCCARSYIEDARAKVARLIHAQPSEIIFTSGGTESNNTIMETFRSQPVALSSIEHPSILESAKARASQVDFLPVDSLGRVDPKLIAYKKYSLISVMLANNELGTIEPLEGIAASCHAQADHITFLHTDATQAIGKIKVDVQALDVDYLSFSAHKIGGPLGVGVLYVRQGAPFRPLLLGGHQECGRRAGTSNTIGIIGLGAAADWCWQEWSCKQWLKVALLRDELRERILNEVPYSSCNSPMQNCLPNILNVSFQGAEGESIQLYLDAEGIAVGTGSACAAGDLQPSHVIMATQHDAEVAHSSIRFSLPLDTKKSDIDRVMSVLPQIVKKLQGMSTIKLGAKHGN